MEIQSPIVPSGSLSNNVAAGLAYLTFVPAIVFLIIPPYRSNSLVRFHSFQSIFFFLAWFVISLGLRFVPFISGVVYQLIALLVFIIWVIAMVRAFQGERWKIPLVGDLAAQQA